MPSKPAKRVVRRSTYSARFRLWFVSVLVVGVVVLVIASALALSLLRHITSLVAPVPTAVPVATLQVQRTARYAGLDYTVINAQYATAFSDDGIHPEPAIVRLNMRVINASTGDISIPYYDVARLLVPHLNPFAPTNINLPADAKARTSETGWIDFSVPKGLSLASLKLQLGVAALDEYMVTIPLTGPFDPGRYQDRTVRQNLTIDYYFPYYQPHLLIYHLTQVDIRYDYQGSQVKAGQQFYVLYFLVDNPNTFNVSPGFGYDYIRLIVNGNPLPPVDNTLPYGFNAGAKNSSGHVAYAAPAGMRSLTIDFLVQYGSGGSYYTISI